MRIWLYWKSKDFTRTTIRKASYYNWGSFTGSPVEKVYKVLDPHPNLNEELFEQGDENGQQGGLDLDEDKDEDDKFFHY